MATFFRPETEELVQKILESKILNDIDCPHILDIGAGTGIIGITLLMQLKNNNARCTSIDINKVAVNLANENACTIMKDQECGTYSCLHSSFEDFIKICHESSQKFDLIVSNPPYIPSEEMVTLQDEVKLYEDHQALHGGEYGLDLVYDIINSSEDLLTETGTKEIWMEVSRSHPVVISRWLSKQPSPSLPHIPQNHLQYRGHFQMIEELVDWSGHPRFVRLKCTK
jgi:release factor glutamine methyltransferase